MHREDEDGTVEGKGIQHQMYSRKDFQEEGIGGMNTYLETTSTAVNCLAWK